MSKECNAKMERQLLLFYNIIATEYHGPDELMQRFGISRRMLQRDLKDLRDAGILNLKYDKESNNYIDSDTPNAFDYTSTGRRRQHLIRLNRLAVLITRLPQTDMQELYRYESEYRDYIDYEELSLEDPETFPPEERGNPPDMPVLEDIKKAYYDLFPNNNERMRQRDFRSLYEAGFGLYYSRKYKAFIYEGFEYYNNEDYEYDFF